jgi:HSP20 family protein
MVFYSGHPFEDLFALQRTLDTFRDSDWFEDTSSGGGSYPPLNVFGKGDDVVVIAEVPGVQKSDLKIEVKDNVLRIAGAKDLHYGDKASMHRRERTHGKFDRTVVLPVEVDADRVKAECRDGILALYLPRAEHAKPKSIKVA